MLQNFKDEGFNERLSLKHFTVYDLQIMFLNCWEIIALAWCSMLELKMPCILVFSQSHCAKSCIFIMYAYPYVVTLALRVSYLVFLHYVCPLCDPWHGQTNYFMQYHQVS